MPTVCIYASSSDGIDTGWKTTARKFSLALAERGFDLVWGCGAVGLMGVAGNTFREAGRRLTGVIPEKLNLPGIVYPDPDELIVTATMSERKRTMIERADAFLALPGGFGTLEEVMEVITLKQLGYLTAPIALCNSGGFYEGLLTQFERFYSDSFAKEAFRELYLISDNPDETASYLLEHKSQPAPDKWFTESLDGRVE